MMKRFTDRRGLWVGLIAAYFMLVLTPAAHAYLDPGSGSLIFQAVIGGVLAGAVAVKAFGSRIRSFFTRQSRQDESDEQVPEKID